MPTIFAAPSPRRIIATSAAAIMLFAISASPALAAEATEISSVEQIEQIIPEVVAETAENDAVDISSDGTIDIDSDFIDEESEAPGISFSIDYVTGQPSQENGLAIYEGAEEGIEAIAQPTSVGVRVMTVISEDARTDHFQYTFDVPEGTELVQNEAGYSLESQDDLLGTIQNPWAVDASGASVPTSFSWAEGILTQHVDLSSPSISYPVVADPAWNYSYKFDVTKTASKNASLLQKCFNCYFPVDGAPRAFPKPNQLLPLKVAKVFNFECKFKKTFSGTNYFGFQFDATKNHVDKAGSNIIFQFRTIGKKKYLTVDAYIVNDAIWVKNNAYRGGAIQAWKKFASNLNNAK